MTTIHTRKLQGLMICTPCQIVFGWTYCVEGDGPGRAACVEGKSAYTAHSNRLLFPPP